MALVTSRRLFLVTFESCFAGNVGGMLRISNQQTSERTLVRSFTGQIVDIGFANVVDAVLVAAIDDTGCLQVFQVHTKEDLRIEYPLCYIAPSTTDMFGVGVIANFMMILECRIEAIHQSVVFHSSHYASGYSCLIHTLSYHLYSDDNPLF